MLLALGATALWLWGLTATNVTPHPIPVTPTLAALPVAGGVGLATSNIGTWIAIQRSSRAPAATAITKAAAGHRSASPARARAGLALIAAALVLSTTLATVAPSQAGDASSFVLLVPLVFAATFGTIKVAVRTTNAAVTGVPSASEDLWTEYSGTAIYCAFAAIAALNFFLTIVIGRRRDLATVQLAGGSRGALLAIAGVQTAIVAATAIVLAGFVALATLAPILHASLDVWTPRIPVAVLVLGGLLTLGIVAA